MFNDFLINTQLELQDRIRARTRTAIHEQSMAKLSEIHCEADDDTIYRLDAFAEKNLGGDIRELFSPYCHLTFVCEGQVQHSYPATTLDSHVPSYILILDPVDGTRGLLYDKRSAWILSAMVEGKDPRDFSLADLTHAVQTEIPTTRSQLSDVLVAIKGQGVQGRTYDLETNNFQPFVPKPSSAETLKGGFATVCRFFPPGRDRLAALDDALLQRVLGPPRGRAHVFEDQYLATGGLVYQLATGRDRFVADLRGVLNRYRLETGKDKGLTCHPYDLCTWLVAAEAGVEITGGDGQSLSFPLDTTSEVSWIGYANQKIRSQVEEHILELIPSFLRYRDMGQD